MIRLLTENGRLISLLVAFVIVAGLGALATLPVAEDPIMTNRYAVIITPYPGANAERVEALVTEKIELSLRELPEVREIDSSSGNGMSTVSVALLDSVMEPELIWSEIRDQLAEVAPELPRGALPSQLMDDRGYAHTMLIALRGTNAAEVPRQIVQRYARELQSRIRAISGTDVVNIDGAVEEEILVNVSSAAAATTGQTVESIAASLSRFDTKASAGLVENASSRIQVEITGDLDSVDRVARVPLTGRGEGQVLRVADIATVSRTLRTPESVKVLRGGQEQLVIAVRMLPSERIARWHGRVTRLLGEFETALPSNIEMQVIFDQRIYTDERMGHLVGNITIGFVLILAILLLTLGWRSAMLVAVALPLMMLFTFMMMNFWGVPINQMSVTGLVVALGITVDNAIVMVDDIAQRKREGSPPTEAVLQALGHLWLPLFGSTITTILAFVAIYNIPGGGGEFMGALAICVIFALIGSYLISHTVVAVLAGRFVDGSQHSSLLGSGIKTPRLSAAFEKLLRLALDRPLPALCLIFLLPLAGFYGITTVPKQFFPPVDRNMFNLEITLPTRTSFEKTERLAREMDAVISAKEGLVSIDWFIGKSASPFYYNLIERRFGAQNYAQAMVMSDSAKRTQQLVRELETELPILFPEARIQVRKLEQGPPVFEPIEIRIYGSDLAILEELGEEIRYHLSTIPAVTSTKASLGQTMPTAVFALNEEILASTPYSPLDSTQSLHASLNGLLVGALLEGTEEIPVRVRMDAGERDEARDLESLNLILQNDPSSDSISPTPLQAIAELELKPRIVSIPHKNGRRINAVGGYVQDGVLPDTVLRQLQSRLEASNFTLPAGYDLEIGGEAEERAGIVSDMLAQIPLIIVMLIVVLVLSFNSWRLCFLILFVAGMAVGLGMLSLTLSGFPFAFQVIISLLGLMGLAINGAIVILAELRATPTALDGDKDGIVLAVMHCVRHISSTTITTVAGFFPLLIGGGAFWPPFAITIAGGTAMVTLLSLIYVPTAFLLLTRRSRFELLNTANTQPIETIKVSP